MPPSPSVLTSPTTLLPLHVFSTTPAASTGRQLSKSFATCPGPETPPSPSLMEGSTAISLGTLTQTVPRTSITIQFQTACFSPAAALFPGSHANTNLSSCPPLRSSTLPRCTQSRKPSGFDTSSPSHLSLPLLL